MTIARQLIPSAVVGTPYVLVLDATGGTPAYSWNVTSGQLPPGISLATPTGIISGSPTASGRYSAEVTLSDASTPVVKKSSTITISVAGPPLAIVNSQLPAATDGQPYVASLQATGGAGGYTWSITSGDLPAGLVLARATGTISGLPRSSGTVTFTATVRDKEWPAQTSSQALTLTVVPAPLQITTLSLPAETNSTLYSQALNANGGTPGYTWSVISGSLPQGLALNAATGTISGMPAGGQSANFTVAVADSGSPAQTSSASFTITVPSPPLTVTNTALPTVTAGVAYTQTLQASGGTVPYRWSVASGTLPAGIALSPTGVISGTPSATGSFTFSAMVADSSSPAQTVAVSRQIKVIPTALKVTAPVIAPVRVGATVAQSFAATGGTAAYKWQLTSGNLPAGLALTTSGTITGVATQSGSATFTATATDSSTPTQTASAVAAIIVAPTPLTITSSTLPAAGVGKSYAQTIQVSGGSAPYTWSITAGSLPAGLSLSPSAGTISGIPTTAVTSAATITVTDSSTPTQITSAPTTLVVAPAALSIVPAALAAFTKGTAYAQSLQALGGTAPYSWSVTAGSLPPGLSLSPSGVISGSPAVSASTNFSVTVTDSGSPSQTQSASLTLTATVAPLSVTAASPLLIVPPSFATATAGTAYTQSLQAAGGTPGYTWSITSGSLPPGLTMAATTGTISGTPAASGTSTFTASITDNGAPVQTQSVAASITVLPAQVSSGSGHTWFVNSAGGTRYSVNVTAGLCDGTTAAAPVGTTPNQHCAFNDIRYLWTDGSYNTDSSAGSPKWGWIGSSGDTYLIDCSGMANSSCRVGQSGPNLSDYFGGLAGNPYGSGMPQPISGSSGQHTKILGINYGSCSTANRTKINGGYGLYNVLDMGGTSYVDVSCFDITDFSSCGRSGQVNACHTSPPIDDYVNTGISWNNTSTYDTLTNVSVHGMAGSGMGGPTGTGVVMNGLSLTGNAAAGWNADAGDGKTGTGTLLVENFNISWNGCAEEYPIVHPLPYQDCTDDNVSGGYGDGFGTATVPSSPGWQVHFDQGTASYNTQDGLDALHLVGSGSSMTITRTLAYGNMGQQIKVGGASGTAQNNLLVTNCNALRQAIPGTPAGYNSRLSDFCRASDTGVVMTVGKGSTLRFDNNTVYTASATAFEIGCDITAGACDSTSLVDFRNNVFLGFMNNTTDGYPGGGTGDYSNPIYLDSYNPFTNTGSVFSHNVTYHPKSNWTCPAAWLNETNALCATDPQLLDETWHVYGNGNMAPAPGSAVVGAGVAIPGMTTDYTGVARGEPSSIGAYE